MKSLEHLFLLGALTDACKLSNPVGHQMARLPLDPMYSKALIQASNFNCLEEMLITVAMLSVESIFYSPREKSEEVYAISLSIDVCPNLNISMVSFLILSSFYPQWSSCFYFLLVACCIFMVSICNRWRYFCGFFFSRQRLQ